MSGTVNISRDLWDDGAFANDRFSEREAWVWMIAEASWKPRQKRVGTAIVNLDRGQLAASVRFMAGAWQWTPAKVQRFLERLKKLEMIRVKTDTGVSVISIGKYDTYQAGGKASDTGPIQDRYRTDTNEKKGERREEGKEDTEALAPACSVPVDAPADTPADDPPVATSPSRSPPPLRRPADEAPPPSKAPPSSHLPRDWLLDEAGREYARKQNLTDPEIQEIADDFRGYWSERTDKKAKRTADGWRRTWQENCRRRAPEYVRNRRVVGFPGPGGSRHGSSLASIAARRRLARQDEDDVPERGRMS